MIVYEHTPVFPRTFSWKTRSNIHYVERTKKAYKHVVFFDEKIILSEEISYSELLRLTREVEIEFNQLQIKS